LTATSLFVRPSPVFRESYLEALREGFNGPARTPMDAKRIDAIADDFEGHLARLDNDGQGTFEEAGRTLTYVPSNTFWLVDGGEFVAAASIRARIDTHILAHFGGHVGYGVRPSLQGKGYGKRLFAEALKVCRGMGVGTVRVSCAENNTGSRRVIEANGGILLRRCEAAWYAPYPYLLYEVILV
jgi:predicted acetyltransferase